jgi:uncharacterized protein (TIGR03435 family)
MSPKYFVWARAGAAATVKCARHCPATWRKLVVSFVAALVFAVPIGFCLAQGEPPTNAPQSQPPSRGNSPAAGAPRFEVASIKVHKSEGLREFMSINDRDRDGRFYATNIPAKLLLRLAYGVQEFQIVGGPSWVNSESFDIQAMADSAVNHELSTVEPHEAAIVKRHMLQALLADRFKLVVHRETKMLPVYALVVAKHGPKLHEARAKNTGSGNVSGTPAPKGSVRFQFGRTGGQITGEDQTISGLTGLLSQQLGRTVLDETGLKGRYDFTLKWSADLGSRPMLSGAAGGNAQSAPGVPPTPGSSDSSGPSIFTAARQQLGLQLKPEKDPVEIIVIDHIEQPSPN